MKNLNIEKAEKFNNLEIIVDRWFIYLIILVYSGKKFQNTNDMKCDIYQDIKSRKQYQ